MQLFEFLHLNRISKKGFAAKLGISYPTFLAYYHSQRLPKLDVAKKIFELTEGKVSIDDFVNAKNAKVNFNNVKQI